MVDQCRGSSARTHARAHAAAAAATAARNTTCISYPRRPRVFVRRPTEAERVYDTHNDALAPNAARMRNTHGVAQWRFNGLSAVQCSEYHRLYFFPDRATFVWG